jgi:hypothetical protein
VKIHSFAAMLLGAKSSDERPDRSRQPAAAGSGRYMPIESLCTAALYQTGGFPDGVAD